MIVIKLIYVLLKLVSAFYGAFVIVHNLFAANDIPLSGKSAGAGYVLLTVLTLGLGFYLYHLLSVLTNRVHPSLAKNNGDNSTNAENTIETTAATPSADNDLDADGVAAAEKQHEDKQQVTK